MLWRHARVNLRISLLVARVSKNCDNLQKQKRTLLFLKLDVYRASLIDRFVYGRAWCLVVKQREKKYNTKKKLQLTKISPMKIEFGMKINWKCDDAHMLILQHNNNVEHVNLIM
jgi:hypothetical protein